ncbi:MAG: hypothetical protein WBQ94_01335, partial [Terracidiphilus sp.]
AQTAPATSTAAGTSMANSSYDPRLTFAPLQLPEPVNAYRSSNGSPGPEYWQNEADYEMHAELDTQAKILRNDEVITYTNNSPDALPSLWIHMEQNLYRKDARGQVVNGALFRRMRSPTAANAPTPSTDGFVLDAVEIERGNARIKVETLIDDTRMQVRLPEPLAPKGVLKLHIKYHYQIPGVWGGRTSLGYVKAGRDLRHGAMVSAHVRLRRPSRLGYAALHWRGILS